MYDGYGNPNYVDEEKLERSMTTWKWSNLVFYVVRFFISLSAFGLCLWVRFDLDFQEWVREINWYTYWYCMYVIMIAMVIEIVTSVVGLYGVLFERTGVLGFTVWTMVFLFFMELTGAIVICLYGVEESSVLTNELHDVFLELVYKWDIDARASRVLKQIMEYVGCCGADGSDDFINAYKPIPWECRDPIVGVEYGYGCQQQLAWWLEPWTATLAAICIFFCVADIIGFFLVNKLRRIIWEYRGTGSVYDEGY